MRSRSLLLWLAAAAAFLLSLIVVMPASVLGYFLPSTVSTGTLTGSIWKGATDSLVVNGHQVGAVQWKLRPLHLLRGRLALDAQVVGPQGRISGAFSLGAGQNLDAQNVELQWPLSGLPINALPAGWEANLQGRFTQLSIDGGVVKKISGVLDAQNVVSRMSSGASIGSYRLTFDDSAEQIDQVVGRLQDTGGPLQVNGVLTLTPNREFSLNTLIATRPGASSDLQQALRFLGEPDESGQRPFTASGAY